MNRQRSPQNPQSTQSSRESKFCVFCAFCVASAFRRTFKGRLKPAPTS